jgi:hypothetical protein
MKFIAILMTAAMSGASLYAGSCIVDPGNEVYPVSEGVSEAVTLATGSSVVAAANTGAVETRHFLSAFSEVWDILAENYPVMIFVK